MDIQNFVTSMIEKAKNNKKRVALIAVVVCLVAIMATGTLAFFAAEETAMNVITSGELKMGLIETTTDGEPFPEEGISNVVPGQVVDKVVTVKNLGNVDFYVRIALDKRAAASDGEALDTDVIALDIDTENWTEKDGYYYYNSAVRPGDVTEPLFNTVTFDIGMGNEYMNARFEIDVIAQTVQSRNNGANALEAGGWTDAE